MSKRRRMQRRESNSHLILLTEASQNLSLVRGYIASVKRHAAREGRRQLQKGGESVDAGVRCGRCGARAWLEEAEGRAFILVEADGRPHMDRCPRALEENGPLSACADTGHAGRADDAWQGGEVDEKVWRCWSVMGEAGQLFCKYEAYLRGGGLQTAALAEVWSFYERCEYLEARFEAALPAYYEAVSAVIALEEPPC